MYQIALLIHLLAAILWIGGHLIILLGYVPRMITKRSFKELNEFEKIYEKLAIPSLIIAVVTGIYMGINW